MKKKYTCRNCGRVYEYCRGCHLSPIPYKSAGFCSEKCVEEFKNKQREEVVQKDVEVVITNKDTPTSEEEQQSILIFFE